MIIIENINPNDTSIPSGLVKLNRSAVNAKNQMNFELGDIMIFHALYITPNNKNANNIVSNPETA